MGNASFKVVAGTSTLPDFGLEGVTHLFTLYKIFFFALDINCFL